MSEHTPEWERGHREGLAWGEVRSQDSGVDLRWVLVGETGDFIRGFSQGLADWPEGDHNRGEGPDR